MKQDAVAAVSLVLDEELAKLEAKILACHAAGVSTVTGQTEALSDSTTAGEENATAASLSFVPAPEPTAIKSTTDHAGR